jgi:hypothetical protein
MLLALATDNTRTGVAAQHARTLCAVWRHRHHKPSLVEVWVDQAERRMWFLNATLDLRQDWRQANAATQQFSTK